MNHLREIARARRANENNRKRGYRMFLAACAVSLSGGRAKRCGALVYPIDKERRG